MLHTQFSISSVGVGIDICLYVYMYRCLDVYKRVDINIVSMVLYAMLAVL